MTTVFEASYDELKKLEAENAKLREQCAIMAAALKQIESEMRAGLGSSYGETREQVRRALRKAEGR